MEVSREELTSKTEIELRKLAYVLRRAISKHAKMARSSLSAKKAAIESREPEPESHDEELRENIMPTSVAALAQPPSELIRIPVNDRYAE